MRWFIRDLSRDYKPYASMFTRRELENLMEKYDLCYDPLSKKRYIRRLVKAGYLKGFRRQGKFQLTNPEIERIIKKSQLEKALEVH
jgi:hypothetical protein